MRVSQDYHDSPPTRIERTASPLTLDYHDSPPTMIERTASPLTPPPSSWKMVLILADVLCGVVCDGPEVDDRMHNCSAVNSLGPGANAYHHVALSCHSFKLVESRQLGCSQLNTSAL
jgi:hypothetical protein